MKIQNILFIGLGNMGAPMAANLLKHGHQLSVSDLNPEAVAKLTTQGAHHAADLKQAAERADAVISMLPAGKHVKGIYMGENGLFKHLKKGHRLSIAARLPLPKPSNWLPKHKNAACVFWTRRYRAAFQAQQRAR